VNKNGILENNEVVVGDSLVYVGAPDPSRTASITNTIGFWNNRFRISTMLDYRGGMGQWDQASAINNYKSRGAVDPNAPLSEQALVVASRMYPKNTYWGYTAKVSYTRLRELTFAYDLPAAWARRLRTQSATVLLLGQNLKLWSSYTGADPEVNTNPYGNNFSDLGGMPLTRNWTLRINLGL
jgi:hypothetical protein